MSEDRETPASRATERAAETPETLAAPGAPVTEDEASHTEVLRAVERATGAADGEAVTEAIGDASVTSVLPEASTRVLDEAELARREAAAEIDTQLDMEPAPGPRRNGGAMPRVAEFTDMPSAAAMPNDLPETPVRDGEIRISADHPMAALYMQTPMQPELKGNRGAGVLITLIATVGFALLYAGTIALRIASEFPPSTFWSEGLLPHLIGLGFLVPVAMFFVAMTLLVLLVGKAGWWAYVLGGLPVGVLVWLAAAYGKTFDTRINVDSATALDLFSVLGDSALMPTAIIAGVLAREVTVWFGAWAGARGRRTKTRNAEALAEYEEALAEARAKQQ